MKKNNNIKKESLCLKIYKLDKSKFNDLNDLNSKFMDKINGDRELVDSSIIEVSSHVNILYFIYKNINSNSIDLPWFSKLKDIFNLRSTLRPESITGHGLIVIHINNCNEYYAFLFGRSFHLIKSYIIFDFGADIASRLFNGESVTSISSKYFSLEKSKSIVEYNENSMLNIEEGQAIDLLVSNITTHGTEIDNCILELLNIIDKKASIGFSNLKLTVRKDKIDLTDLISIVELIIKIGLFDEVFSFPRMVMVDKEKSDYLDKEFINYLLDRSTANDISFEKRMSIPLYLKDGSDIYTFIENITGFRFKYNRNISEVYDYLDIIDIKDFIKMYQIDNINKVKLTILNDSGHYIEDLKNWIEVDINKNGIDYSLVNGIWYTYNESYKNRVNQKVIEIENKILNKNPVFSVSKEELDIFLNDNFELISNSFSKNNTPPYREYLYNYILTQKDDWYLFDRIIVDTIELCDINIKGIAYVHVKIGDTKDLEFVLRQSINGTRYIHSTKIHMNDFKNNSNEKLTQANYAVVLFLTEKSLDNFSFSNIKSLRCKLTFINWFQVINEIRLKPILIVAEYKQSNTLQSNLRDRLENLSII